MVPGLDPVCGEIIACLQVAVHPQEPGHEAIYRVRKCRGVKGGFPGLSEEILFVRLQVQAQGSRQIAQSIPLIRLTTTSKINGSNVVSTRDLTGDKKVLLSESS